MQSSYNQPNVFQGSSYKSSKEICVSITPCCLKLGESGQKESTIEICNNNDYPLYFKLLTASIQGVNFEPQFGRIDPMKKVTVVGYPERMPRGKQQIAVMTSHLPLEKWPPEEDYQLAMNRVTPDMHTRSKRLSRLAPGPGEAPLGYGAPHFADPDYAHDGKFSEPYDAPKSYIMSPDDPMMDSGRYTKRPKHDMKGSKGRKSIIDLNDSASSSDDYGMPPEISIRDPEGRIIDPNAHTRDQIGRIQDQERRRTGSKDRIRDQDGRVIDSGSRIPYPNNREKYRGHGRIKDPNIRLADQNGYAQEKDGRSLGPEEQIIGPDGRIIGLGRRILDPDRRVTFISDQDECYIGSDGSPRDPDGRIMHQNMRPRDRNDYIRDKPGYDVGPRDRYMGPDGRIISSRNVLDPDHPVRFTGDQDGRGREPDSHRKVAEGRVSDKRKDRRIPDQDDRLPHRGIRPDICIARPDGRFIGPQDLVIGPDGRVKGPGGHIIGPDDRIIRPDDRVIGPNDRIIGPDDLIIGPDDGIIGPSGRTSRLGDRIMGPDDRILRPDGQIVRPDGLIVTPDGQTIRPDYQIERPDGHIVRPDDRIVRPDGHVVRPGGHIVRPDGHIIGPAIMNKDRDTSDGDDFFDGINGRIKDSDKPTTSSEDSTLDPGNVIIDDRGRVVGKDDRGKIISRFKGGVRYVINAKGVLKSLQDKPQDLAADDDDSETTGRTGADQENKKLTQSDSSTTDDDKHGYLSKQQNGQKYRRLQKHEQDEPLTQAKPKKQSSFILFLCNRILSKCNKTLQLTTANFMLILTLFAILIIIITYFVVIRVRGQSSCYSNPWMPFEFCSRD